MRSHLKVVRLNDAELETFERKRLRRHIDASTYLRTLVEEDGE